jgi:hypothetical protein
MPDIHPGSAARERNLPSTGHAGVAPAANSNFNFHEIFAADSLQMKMGSVCVQSKIESVAETGAFDPGEHRKAE